MTITFTYVFQPVDTGHLDDYSCLTVKARAVKKETRASVTWSVHNAFDAFVTSSARPLNDPHHSNFLVHVGICCEWGSLNGRALLVTKALKAVWTIHVNRRLCLLLNCADLVTVNVKVKDYEIILIQIFHKLKWSCKTIFCFRSPL